MTATDIGKLFAVLALVLLNGFFVAAEFAIVKVRLTRLEELTKGGNRLAKSASEMVRHLDAYLSATQLGITLASLALGWIGEPALAHLIEPLVGEKAHALAIGIAFFIITLLHIVLGELAPKSLAIQKSETVTLWVALPMKFFYRVFKPFIWLLNGTANFVLARFGIEPASELENVHSPEEIVMLIKQGVSSGSVDTMEAKMAGRVFRFGDLRAEDVMIHRMDMFALDILRPAKELIDEIAENIHTRIPIYEEEIDNIIGVLHKQDFVRELRFAEDADNLNLRALVRPALHVPEQLHLDRLLDEMRSRKTQIAILNDEYGGVTGMVTLEDIVEEVFGEIQDELEADLPRIQETDDGRILARGEVRMDELEEHIGWTVEPESTATLAAYVSSHLTRVPRLGDTVETPRATLRVENMAQSRITQVAILPKEDAQDEEEVEA